MKMELSKEEQEFLVHTLKGDFTWTSNMRKQYDFYDKNYNLLLSILTKLGAHPLADKLGNEEK